MSTALPHHRTWLASVRAFGHPRVITMLFLGFSAGLPLLLIFSSLSLWLREADVERAMVTFFSWAALGYSFKFVWAPLIDRLPIPRLTARLGRRRAWLLVAQGAVIAAIVTMAMTDPAEHLVAMGLAAVMLGFAAATQDIVIDAYRIESAAEELQALMASTYIAGYRIGMLVAGAGALKLAALFGSAPEAYAYSAWQLTYLCMALAMGVGVVTTLIMPEPQVAARPETDFRGTRDYLRFLGLFIGAVGAFVAVFVGTAGFRDAIQGLLVAGSSSEPLAGFLGEVMRLAVALGAGGLAGLALVRVRLVDYRLFQVTYVEPVADFIRRYQRAALIILLLIGTYRISDIVLGVISTVFYQDLGFSKDAIADVSKTFGLFMTLLGGFLGGLLAVRFGIMRILLVGALLAAATNLLFAGLAQVGPDIRLLAVVIAADNISAGIAQAAFVAYLSSLTSVSFTALQYAIFSSLMTLFPKVLGGYSGTLVDGIGYEAFFYLTAALGVPVLGIVWLAGRLTRSPAKVATD